jgi:hypothetical protein
MVNGGGWAASNNSLAVASGKKKGRKKRKREVGWLDRTTKILMGHTPEYGLNKRKKK